MEVQIVDDATANEPPEVFQVNFILSQQDQQGSELINPVSMVTIIDDDVGECEMSVNCYIALVLCLLYLYLIFSTL